MKAKKDILMAIVSNSSSKLVGEQEILEINEQQLHLINKELNELFIHRENNETMVANMKVIRSSLIEILNDSLMSKYNKRLLRNEIVHITKLINDHEQ
jgi:hypothetical protein